LHARRIAVENVTVHETFGLELLEAFREQTIREIRNAVLYLREASGSLEEDGDDGAGPPLAYQFDRLVVERAAGFALDGRYDLPHEAQE